MVKNLPSNAEIADLIPGWGRPHMPLGNKAHVSQLLSPCTAITEAHMPRASALQQEKPWQREARELQQK